MLFSFIELFDMVIMTLLVGFIFSDIVAPQKKPEDLIDKYLKKKKAGFDYKQLGLAAAITAPGVIFHELGHKFVAMSFGFQATFHAFYADTTTLVLGIIAIIAKLAKFGFLFFVPGFVSFNPAGMTPLQGALISFAGPAVNLIFWLGTAAYLKYGKVNKKHYAAWFLTKQINMFLFILNMLPLPGIDGFSIYSNLFKAFF